MMTRSDQVRDIARRIAKLATIPEHRTLLLHWSDAELLRAFVEDHDRLARQLTAINQIASTK